MFKHDSWPVLVNTEMVHRHFSSMNVSGIFIPTTQALDLANYDDGGSYIMHDYYGEHVVKNELVGKILNMKDGITIFEFSHPNQQGRRWINTQKTLHIHPSIDIEQFDGLTVTFYVAILSGCPVAINLKETQLLDEQEFLWHTDIRCVSNAISSYLTYTDDNVKYGNDFSIINDIYCKNPTNNTYIYVSEYPLLPHEITQGKKIFHVPLFGILQSKADNTGLSWLGSIHGFLRGEAPKGTPVIFDVTTKKQRDTLKRIVGDYHDHQLCNIEDVYLTYNFGRNITTLNINMLLSDDLIRKTQAITHVAIPKIEIPTVVYTGDGGVHKTDPATRGWIKFSPAGLTSKPRSPMQLPRIEELSTSENSRSANAPLLEETSAGSNPDNTLEFEFRSEAKGTSGISNEAFFKNTMEKYKLTTHHETSRKIKNSLWKRGLVSTDHLSHAQRWNFLGAFTGRMDFFIIPRALQRSTDESFVVTTANDNVRTVIVNLQLRLTNFSTHPGKVVCLSKINQYKYLFSPGKGNEEARKELLNMINRENRTLRKAPFVAYMDSSTTTQLGTAEPKDTFHDYVPAGKAAVSISGFTAPIGEENLLSILRRWGVVSSEAAQLAWWSRQEGDFMLKVTLNNGADIATLLSLKNEDKTTHRGLILSIAEWSPATPTRLGFSYFGTPKKPLQGSEEKLQLVDTETIWKKIFPNKKMKFPDSSLFSAVPPQAGTPKQNTPPSSPILAPSPDGFILIFQREEGGYVSSVVEDDFEHKVTLLS